MSQSSIDPKHANTVLVITTIAEISQAWTFFNKTPLAEITTSNMLLETIVEKVETLLKIEGNESKKEFLGIFVNVRGAIITLSDILNRIKEGLSLEHTDVNAIYDDYKNQGIPVVKIFWVLGRAKYGINGDVLQAHLQDAGLLEVESDN